jgi:valyl-tRNA synthetase
VKNRAYSDTAEAASASRALRLALDVLLRLFAPVLPFATEEVWSWWHEDSVHRQSWPSAADLRAAGGRDVDVAVLEVAGEVLGQVRKAKSNAKSSMRTPVDKLVVRDTAERIGLMRLASVDIVNAGVVSELVLEEGEPDVAVTLAPPE